VNEHPLSVSANSDRDRLHERTAVCRTVPWGVCIEMTGPQAVGAVVAVSGPDGMDRHVQPAMAAAERARPMALVAMALVA